MDHLLKSGVSDAYLHLAEELHVKYRLHSVVKILIVVDGGISLTESPSGFGIGRVVRLLRETAIGCVQFKVDLARREGAAATNPNPATPGTPTYTGFRFDLQANGQPVLNDYHEVWCFGFNPGNNDGAPDSDITQPGALPCSDAELASLTRWMNERHGGVLAMGDHDYLGASMCHRIPRVGTMRRWTNAQGVPPVGGFGHADTALRHDTNQPATPGQQAGVDLIPFLVQNDAVPQKIEWATWMQHRRTLFSVRRRPHPVLCHPTLGPIDVFPDHPHEGWCYEAHEVDVSATYSFNGYGGDEYPNVGGQPFRPFVAAHGYTTPNPPFNLEKGESPRKRFALVSTYDGHKAGVGRVVVDSTWHHWFDENIQQLEAAGGDNWEKISRYFLNVASWLAPPGALDAGILCHLVTSHFRYVGLQEYSPKASVWALGQVARLDLIRIYGPCWVTQWILDKIQVVDDDFFAWLWEHMFGGRIPKPEPPCLSCPPFDDIEAAILGAIIQETLPQVRAAIKGEVKGLRLADPEVMSKLALGATKNGLKEVRHALQESIRDMQPILR